MSNQKFNGETNIEQALGILPPHTEILDLEIASDDQPDTESFGDLTVPDKDIKDELGDLYDRAIDAYDSNLDEIDAMESKYVSRAMEVSKGYLDMALDALKLKQQQIQHAHKMELELKKLGNKSGKQVADTINNNTILVGNRNDILRDAMKSIPIDSSKEDADDT